MKSSIPKTFRAMYIAISLVTALLIPFVVLFVEDKILSLVSTLLVISLSCNFVTIAMLWISDRQVLSMSPVVIACSVWEEGGAENVTILSEPTEFFSLGDRVVLFYLDGKMEIRIGSAVVHNIQTDKHVQFVVEKYVSGQNLKWDAIKKNSVEALAKIKVRAAVGGHV